MRRVREIVRGILMEVEGSESSSSSIESVKLHIDPSSVERLKAKMASIFRPFLEFFPLPEIRFSGPFTEKKFIPNQGPKGEGELIEITYVMAEIDLPRSISLPGGNELVAVIDNDSGTYKIIGDNRGIPSQKLRPYGACDHCGMTRARTFNFLIQDDKGEYKCVGSTCVKKYLGVSPDKVLRAMDLINQMSISHSGEQDVDPFSEFSGGGRKRTISWLNMHTSTNGLVNFIYDFVKREGYVKKEYEYTDTGNRIPMNPDSNTFDKITKNIFNMMDEHGDIDWEDESSQIRNSLIDFIKAQRPSEFNSKILNSLKYDTTTYLSISTIAYACNAMIEGARRSESQHIGQVGDKIKDVPVIINSVRSVDTMYGMLYFVTFLDGNGNMILYKGSAPPKETTGAKGLLSGTIKAHDSFNNNKQTVVQRIKFIPTND